MGDKYDDIARQVEEMIHAGGRGEDLAAMLRKALSAPSPVGREAREIALKVIVARDFYSMESAASIIQSALDAAVAGERERVVEECKAALGLLTESSTYEAECKALDAIKEAKR